LFDDALFLRRVSDLEALDADDFTRWLMLKKLAFISIVYSQFEYALRCLDAARRFTDHSRAGDRTKPRYIAFLSELEREIANVPQEYPRTFASKYSFADSKARFGTSIRKKNIVLKVSVSAKHFAVYSNVETVLMRYGFQALADLLKHNRLVQDSVADFLSENPGFDNEYDISTVKLNIEN